MALVVIILTILVVVFIFVLVIGIVVIVVIVLIVVRVLMRPPINPHLFLPRIPLPITARRAMIPLLVEPLIVVNRRTIIRAAMLTSPRLTTGIAELGSARATAHGQHFTSTP